MTGDNDARPARTFTSEQDPQLHRLVFLVDGVYAIALTLLAVDLILPEAAANLHGEALLRSLLEAWPKLLAFLTSFTAIANFWVGHNALFQHVRRFDGGLMWLAFLQLLCIAFIPFPTSVIGEHVGDPVAQQFYFGTILVTGLVMVALWRYMNSGRSTGASGLEHARNSTHKQDLPGAADDLPDLHGSGGRGRWEDHQPAAAELHRDLVLYRTRDTRMERVGAFRGSRARPSRETRGGS